MDRPSLLRRRWTVPAVLGFALLSLPAVPSPAAAAACAWPAARGGLAHAAKSARCHVNRQRALHRRTALRPYGRLAAVARRHARDMVRRGYFAHVSPAGTVLGHRLRRARLRTGLAGEALGWGCGAPAGPEAIVQAWMASPPHRRVLLDPRYRRIGIGVVPGVPTSGCAFGLTWVLVASP